MPGLAAATIGVFSTLSAANAKLVSSLVSAPAVYWRGGYSSSWYDLQNWFTTSSGATQANELPTSASNIIIAASGLVINLDYNQGGVTWVAPASINSGAYNVSVDSTSSPGAVFNTNFYSTTGTWYFLHNSQLGQP